MLRLTRTAQPPSNAVLHIDGQITADQIAFLADYICRCRQQVPHLILQIDGVEYIDPEGIELLHQWCDPASNQGVVLRGGSPFLRALLLQDGLKTC